MARRFNSDFRIVPVRAHSVMSEQLNELAPSADFQVRAPTPIDERPITTSGNLSAHHVRRFKKIMACGYSSAIYTDGAVAVPDHYVDQPDRTVADARFLLWQGDAGHGLDCADAGPDVRTQGILLFGSGTFNWCHWLVEQLPAAFLAERLPDSLADVSFIVPERALEVDSFKDSLSLFTRDRPVEAISHSPCRFDSLYVLDSLVQEPINMPAGRWPSPRDYAYHPEVMRPFRSVIIDRLGIARRPADRRIFLARGHGRCSYNQDEALSIAAEYGFEAVFPERLIFREQVQMMHDAACVVGPSGAAFDNTLFCQSGTRLLSWLIPEYGGFCSYSNLATITGSDLRHMFTPTDRPIRSTSEAFAVNYHLNADEFGRAIEHVSGQSLEHQS